MGDMCLTVQYALCDITENMRAYMQTLKITFVRAGEIAQQVKVQSLGLTRASWHTHVVLSWFLFCCCDTL